MEDRELLKVLRQNPENGKMCIRDRSQGLGCSPIKAVRELGSERRETVRSLSVVGAGNLRGAVLSTRGPGWTYLWCTGCRPTAQPGSYVWNG